MPINQTWLDRNAGRQYPVDDSATGTDDAGLALTSTILADARLRWPRSAGQYAFISAASVTQRLVTVTFLASEALDSAGSFLPLAAVSVLDPVPYKPYPISGQMPGVGGYVVFGEAIKDGPVSHRFSLPEQSFLSPQTARPYGALPVLSISAGGLGGQLSGIIKLSGGNDIEVVKECREVPVELVGESCDPLSAVAREVVVVRLKNKNQTEDTVRNVFDIYKGCCQGRPESGNCGDPQPIEKINGIEPNCCGTIVIKLSGCAVPAITEDGHGIVIDCGIGLVDACNSDLRLPDADGRLPNEYDGDCEEAISEISLCGDESL